MKICLTTAFLFLQIWLFAQDNTPDPALNPSSPQQKIETTPASFPSGNDVFQQLLAKNFRVKNVNCEIPGPQSTMIEFAVEKDGTLSEIKSIGANQSLNEEAVRAVKSINIKWNPATSGKQNIRTLFKQPFRFLCE